MNVKNTPAESYIKRPVKTTPILVRIPIEEKIDAKRNAQMLGTSLQRYIEAAVIWYNKQVGSELGTCIKKE